MAVDRVGAIAQVPLFGSLTKRQLRRLAKGALVFDFQPKEAIVREGTPGETMFVILEGTARVTRGSRLLRHLGPGEFFGDIAVFDRRARSGTVRADTHVRCLALHRDELRAAFEADPKMAW